MTALASATSIWKAGGLLEEVKKRRTPTTSMYPERVFGEGNMPLLNLDLLGQIVVAAQNLGESTTLARGLAGWLVIRSAGIADHTTDETRANYRRILEDVLTKASINVEPNDRHLEARHAGPLVGMSSRKGRMGDSQPMPTPNTFPGIHGQVADDIEARRLLGISRYGTVLQPYNGRNALQDLYEEILDAAVYCKQALVEQS